ncbi:membrane protein [Lactobacillus plantarum] [Lactiplantibacillus mudanjiangensis]|uniref:zinc ribbon domain-containing protein n=1 Tax=Lactiplantibacillus mudanjiangensis TaxID=1296538 RepID=UPI001014F098|nr:zinc ribbon domain-containing protein [Lactiplantibacillus mudanjiangensis]VDG32769.1 membrane protein [Lactobacillus plantarum] [Lactiplantibacillus mudanjiangensis]
MQKFCPNCGEETDGNTRFCTHCGYDLQADQATETTEAPNQTTTDDQPTATPTNDRVAQVQAYSKNYFKWLVDSFKKPDLEEPGERYFGIISMVLSALLLTFAIVAAFNRCIKQINASAASSVVVLKNLSFGMDFKFFMLVLIVILFYVVIGYGASALGNNQETRLNFFDYLNRFAHLTNIGLILNLILIISVYTITFNVNSPLTFFKQLGFAIVVLALISVVWQAGYIIAIHKSIKTPRIDKFFMVLLALIVMAIALYIFARIEWENLALDFAQEFSQGTSAGSLFNLF